MPNLFIRTPRIGLPADDFRTRSATARPTTWNAETRTVEAIISTGAGVMRRDGRGPFVETLDLSTIDPKSLRDLPILDGHATGSVRHTIGVVVSASREPEGLVAVLRIGMADDIEPIAQRIAEGLIRNVSIGYAVTSERESVVDGRRVKTVVPRIREISLVVNGADPGAQLRVAPMPENIELTETNSPTEGAEAARVRALAEAVGFTDDEAEGFIRSGLGLDDVRTIAQTRNRERAAAQPTIRTASVGASNDDPSVVTRRMGDAMAYRMGGGGEPAPELRAYLADPVTDLMKRSLEMAGVSTRGLSRDDIMTRAMTTSDFPIAVGNAMGKVAADAYRAAESPLKVLFKSRNLPNFKPSQSVRLGGSGRFEEITESGEIRHTSRAENGETMKLGTYAQGISVSRKLLIDDDLGLLGDMTAALGTAAAQTENDLIVATVTGNPKLSDGKYVFHATRGNIGTAGAPSLTTLDEARKAMRGRTDLDEKTLINVQPKYLVVGPELETEAEQLLAAIYASNTAEVNPFSGKLQLLVEPRITDASWYVFGDPARTPALQFAYLSSAPGVQIQRTEAWDVLGSKWRAWLDFGCGWLDWRGAQFNAGA